MPFPKYNFVHENVGVIFSVHTLNTAWHLSTRILWFLDHLGFNREKFSNKPFTRGSRLSNCQLIMLAWNGIFFLSHLRHHGPVMTTGVNSDIVKACGIAFTIITLTARPHPVSSGKRTIITAKNGRNTKVLRPRYSCWKSCFCKREERIHKHFKKVCFMWNQIVDIICLQEALLMSEKSRLAEQGKFTPVWKLRQDPPRDWHLPLNQERPQDSWKLPPGQQSLFHSGQWKGNED